jgi:cystathionine gamma-synthase
MTALLETQDETSSRAPDRNKPEHSTPIARTPVLRSRTKVVRAGIATDAQHGAVVPPLHLSSTFAFAGFGQPREFDYTRSGNPTRAHLAGALSELEEGAAAIVTSTGMSAIALVLQLLKPGDTILCAHDCYGGTHRLLQALSARGQFQCQFADLSAPGATDVIAASGCKLVWIETPSNPLLRITDIQVISSAAHRAEALAVVDNTFLSPALQRPITLGADIVVHSTTKYLNGHSDVVGGAVVAANAAVAENLAWWANCLGLTGAPFDSYLTLRGLRTLHPRMVLHEENASQIVNVLADHPAVSTVHYPGLTTHPGHDLAARQQSGFGAMLSFELVGGPAAARQLVSSLRCFTLAESLGGVESLIAHPATMTHASMDALARHAAGISDSLFRLSVGIEDGDDLADDLRQALDQALIVV